MRKAALLVCVLSAFFMGGVSALEIGGEAPSLEVRDWIFGGKVDFAVPKELQKSSQKLTVLVCWGTWLTEARDVTPLLEQLQKDYRAKDLRVILVSAEPKATVEQFFTDKKQFNCFVGVDDQEKTTRAYMGMSRLFPKAFLINQAGQVIWGGEAFDLKNMIELYYAKTFSVDDWKKLGKLYEDLEVLLRSRFDESIVKTTDQILAMNPEDGFAIRARLFYYNTANRNDQAIAFLEARQEKSPHNAGIYLAAFNILSGQFPQDEVKTLKFANEYLANFGKEPVALQQLALILLRDFGYMNGTLEVAARIIPVLQAANGLTGPEKGAALSTVALYHYKTGQLAAAVARQDEAVKLLPANQADAARKLLEFYKSAQRLQGSAQK